jgi:selenocysteine lyase/cysteine desulfurase
MIIAWRGECQGQEQREKQMHTGVAAERSVGPADMRKTIPYVDNFIHLNSAAGSLADQCVHDAIVAHLELEARCGNTEARLATADRINGLYSGLSQLTHVPEARISVGDSHTAAWQTAFQAIPLGEGDRILVGETEWGGNLSAIWQRCRATGAVMDVIPSGPSGGIDPKALSHRLDGRAKLVCVTLAPAINGLVNPIGPILEALSGHPAWLFVDAAQAFANVIQDLSELRFDLVTVSARKYLRAPRGTGFATYSQRFLDEIAAVGLDQFSGPWTGSAPVPLSSARKFEFIETSFAVRLGLKAAVDLALSRDLGADMRRIGELADCARAALAALPGVTVQDTHDTLSGIVTFSHARRSPSEIQAALKAKRINVAAPQEPYAPLWMHAGRRAVTRLSPHAFNTHAEIEIAVAAIAAL